jgi:chemotaxis protein histidine kinase CheA/ActR/RegA family two-component response regulator
MSDNTEALLARLRDLKSAIAADMSPAQIIEILVRHLADIGEDAAAAGYPGLLDICLMLKDGLDSLPDKGGVPNTSLAEALGKWPGCLIDYIEDPSTIHKNTLMQLLCHPAWGSAIDTDTTELLKAMLDIVPATTKTSASAITDLDFTAADGPSDESATGAWDSLDTTVSKDAPPQLRELLEIMIAELGNIHQSIGNLMVLYNTQGQGDERIEKALHELSQSLEFYSEAVRSIEFAGLAEVVLYTRQNIMTLAGITDKERSHALALLGAWPEKILAYLRNPVAAGSVRNLLDFMQDSGWPLGIDDNQASVLEAAFASQEYKVQDNTPGRNQTATAEDVSLALQDDVSQDLLEGLLSELPLQTEQFSAAIQRLINGGTQEDIIIAKRVAHTLKGAGNTVGIRGIATLTHQLEDILLVLSKNECLPGGRIAEVLMNASDCLSAMSEALLGLGDPPGDAQAIMQEVLDLANLIDREGIDAVNIQSSTQRSPAFVPAAAPAADTGKINIQEPSERETSAMIRVSSEFIDNLLRLAGETIIMTGQIRNSIKVTLAEMKEMEKNFELLKHLGGKVEEIIDIRDLNQAQQAGNNEKYDALEMDQYTELHMFSRQLVEMAMDADEVSRSISKNLVRLEDMLVDQYRINDEMQEGVMRTRMLPVSSQFPRLQRCVRQAEKLTGKVVDLKLDGGETLVDSDTLNSLMDPLMHLLRNAVDHGIETENERVAAGKDPHGRIHLEFSRQGNYIEVRCQDDGRGLDLPAIRDKAVNLGLLRPDQEITDEDLKQFIMHSGFSTRNETTQVSGRGIGMDAVNASITSMSGIIRLDSESGHGCLVEIRIPLNLISLHTLLIRVGSQIVAIANRGIAQIIHPENGRLDGSDENRIFHTDDRDYPAQSIDTLLNIVPERRSQKRHAPIAILVHAEQVDAGMLALMVDKIIGTANLVVKGLGQYVPKLPGIIGVGILGDGSVTPVLDVPELLRARAAGGKYSQFTRTDYNQPRLPTALVVDDSLSARRSLEQFMQDAGYMVRTARDGLEAFDMIKTHKPDILLSDLEMPRMNGVELIAHVRADQALADVPIIMITSRAAVKHRQEAIDAGVDVYLTKPFSEDELLEHIHKLRRAS